MAAADAAIATAKSLVIAAEANVESAQATIERIQADINDSTLKAPRDGRVQYRVAQPGEVLAAGGKVLNMVDLDDVYMTFFLPTDWAGRVKLGADVRLVLDAAPQFVIPAKVTFVADVAQFTPKTVETAEERQKLTFRDQGPHRSGPAQEVHPRRQDRVAGSGLRAARPAGRVARQSAGEASGVKHMTHSPQTARRTCARAAAPPAAGRTSG